MTFKRATCRSTCCIGGLDSFTAEKAVHPELGCLMKANCPSATALRVATRRAAHQVIDDPLVFCDPLALRILGMEIVSAPQLHPKMAEQTAVECRLRAFLAARSRYAEDELHIAVKRGVCQYVVLGAGLDTFAYRNTYPQRVLHVFEVDHPATQTWKRACLMETGIPIPATLTYSPVNFEKQTLEEGLRQSGFDAGKCTFFSWLGVTPYLTHSAVDGTLHFVASMPAGSGIIFDYMISPSLLNPTARLAFDGLARRVVSAGEPFKTCFDPALLKRGLEAMGFRQTEDIEPGEMNARYFQGRHDGLQVGSLSHIMNAHV